jgi:NAD(P)-dependent dehydrogenase (short-subunit alcohol dehydrogenase family)
MEIRGITAVITGSTGSLGRHIALSLARAGCSCVCGYHKNHTAAEQLVGEIIELGVDAVAICADIAEPEQIEELFDHSADLDKPRILINSAGCFSRQPLSEVTFDNAALLLDTNLTGPIMLSRIFAELVTEYFSDSPNPAAKIINITDIAGISPWPGYSIYCASKAGIIAATKSLAAELAPRILVNAVAPGIITPPAGLDSEQEKRQLRQIPAGRFGNPQEITSAVMFLLQNDYINGQVITIDGGKTI